MHCNGHISKENDCRRLTEMQCNPTLTAGEHVPQVEPQGSVSWRPAAWSHP